VRSTAYPFRHSSPTSNLSQIGRVIALIALMAVVLAGQLCAQTILPLPTNQAATALNNSVAVGWKAISPNSAFDHYAIYRATTSFASVSAMTPIGTVTNRTTVTYTDNTALNGTHYYYAVTTVANDGGQNTTISSIGPFTPRDETDLQVISVSRTPRYPRYLPNYTYYTVTEPSGFGPYVFSAATSLAGGQTGGTQRWPSVGATVTYTATVRNRGTNTWSGSLGAAWTFDGGNVGTPSQSLSLSPGATATYTYTRPWDGNAHDIVFTINLTDARATNNSLGVNTMAAEFLTYVDKSYIEKFRELTVNWPQADTDDIFDWLNRHQTRFTEMFAASNALQRTSYGVLQPLNDTDADPTSPSTVNFAVFPFRYRASDGDARLSGYYHQAEDMDYGLLHEMGHQLGLVDIYRMNVDPAQNQVSGQGYSAVASLMNGCSPYLSDFDAAGLNRWWDKAHGYYGQYMYYMPETMILRILGHDGQPLGGVTVKMYQKCERPGLGEVITSQIKAQGVTDANGLFLLPNVYVDPAKVPTTYSGDTLHDNPFGYLAVVGTNAVLYFRLEYNGGVDYCWLDVTEANVAYNNGQTETATFDRTVALGGPVQFYPPNDMAEMNAADWGAWAQGSDSLHTYVTDDTSRKQVGSGSIHFTTDGGFDTYSSYPTSLTAQWDLRQATSMTLRVYAIDTNSPQFQNGSPWILLKDSNGSYYQYQYYLNGGAYDYLNNALNNWRTYTIPINPPSSQTGWNRTSFGTPDIARINRFEFHADTWGGGFQYWLDGVSISFSGGNPVTTIRDAKAAADNTRVDLTGAIVSAAWPGVFYIETADRALGIRVEQAGHTLTAGQTARIFGYIRTNSDGERLIDASWAMPDGAATVKPLGTINRSLGGTNWSYNGASGAGQRGVLGGQGPNNIGLLVSAFGKVTAVDTAVPPTWYRIDDGSGVNIKVVLPSGASAPGVGDYVTVTGASSCYAGGGDLCSQVLVR